MATYPAASLQAECQRLKVDDCLGPSVELELIKESVNKLTNSFSITKICWLTRSKRTKVLEFYSRVSGLRFSEVDHQPAEK